MREVQEGFFFVLAVAAIVGVVALGVYGCARLGDDPSSAEIQRFAASAEPGKTTQQEVEHKLGAPVRRRVEGGELIDDYVPCSFIFDFWTKTLNSADCP